jgi:ribonucleoside-diphosphate reductase alpha subunit
MEEVSNIKNMIEEDKTRAYERRVTHVIKRDNKRTKFSLEKISARIAKLCWNLDPEYIDPDSISKAVSNLMYEDIRTEEIDFLTADLCANKIYVHPDFNLLAGRICISNLHKTTDPNFYNVMTRLYQHKRDGCHNPLVSKELNDIVIEHKDKIQEQFRFEKDYSFNFFALKTLEKAYLTRIKCNKNKTISEQNENEHELRKRYGIIVERPQHMFMRVAIGIHGNDLERAFETYHAMSNKLFIHATPTLYNAGTPLPQLSSCFLMWMQDSLRGMYNVTISDAAQISKRAGGIGISLSDIRANGSYIRGTNGVSDGIIPLCRVLNEVSVHVNQGGRRNGSIACYLEVHHPDIWNFTELRLKSGDEKMRARKLFLALWVSDLFMKRVWNDEIWSLMCPDECPGLTDVYGDEYEKLYIKYETEGKYKRQISAKKLWIHILESQIETGMPYMAYKDHGNRKSNQKNLGTIKCSNLCCEIFEYTSATETAVCNLASLCLPTYINDDGNGNKTFDFAALAKSARIMTRNLNRIIDINFYPVEATKNSNLKHRPIGIGVQGFADALYKMGYSFVSREARILNKKIFEAIYFGAVSESVMLAKEFGPYSSFKGSPSSEGKLQFHLWDLSVDDLLLGWDWDSLINDVVKYGLYNSLLTAVMPTASTAHIMGNYECTEVPTTNMYVRNTQTGEYIVANEHLMRDLLNLGLWTKDIIDEIQYDGGSIQNIDKIPDDIKELYMTAYEVPKRVMIDLTADRGPFIDQSQSFNIFNDKADFKVLTSVHFYGWQRGLKTGMYYHRGRPASDGIKFGIDSDIINSIKEKRSRKQDPRRTNEIEDNQSVKICRYLKPEDNYESCEMCSG